MIAAFMLYGIAISLLLGAAAVACERALRLAHRPARFVWLTAMVVAIGTTVMRFETSLSRPASQVDTVLTDLLDSAQTTPVAAQSTRERSASTRTSAPATRTLFQRLAAIRVPVMPDSRLTRLDQPLLIGWLACSLLGFVLIGLSALQLARPRPPWPLEIVDGFPVRMSHDVGPAVIGLFRYHIVIPKWVLDLAPSERDLVLAHEREHVAAGDSTLLFATTVLVALCPWNLALWWMARRLRFAIELDCDARVLRFRPDGSAYGALLIAVNERTHGGAMPIVALAEPVSLTERRIAAITSRAPRFALLRAIAAGSVASVLIGVSCAAPGPTRGRLPIRATLPPAPATSSSPTIPSNAPARVTTSVPTQPRDSATQKRIERAASPVSAGDSGTSSLRPVTASQPIPAPDRVDTSAPPGGRGLGRGGAPSGPGMVDSILRRLFDGIALTPDQESRARELITHLQADQQVQTAAAIQAITASSPRRMALQAQRDSALRALLTSDADRAAFDARVTVGRGGRSGGGPPIPLPAGGGRGGGGAPAGGGRGGRGGTLESVVELTVRRLLDGLALSPDDSTKARAIISETQIQLQALMPRIPTQIMMPPNSRAVIMQAKSDSALAALLTNDADRATLHSRIVIAAPPQP